MLNKNSFNTKVTLKVLKTDNYFNFKATSNVKLQPIIVLQLFFYKHRQKNQLENFLPVCHDHVRYYVNYIILKTTFFGYSMNKSKN